MEALCIWSLKSIAAPDTAIKHLTVQLSLESLLLSSINKTLQTLFQDYFIFIFWQKMFLFCFLKADEQTKDYFSSMKLFRNNGTSSQLARDTSTTPTQTFIYIYFKHLFRHIHINIQTKLSININITIDIR